MNWLNAIVGSSLVQSLGWTLLHFFWQGAIIALAVAFVFVVLSAKSANIRYLAGCVALAASALSPIATFTYVYTADARPAVSTTTTIAVASDSNGIVKAQTPTEHHNNASSPAASARPPWLPIALAIFVVGWICGVIYYGIQLLNQWLKEERYRQFGVEPVDERLRGLCAILARRIGVTRQFSVLLSTTISVPMIIGWLRPSLLLPVTFITNLEPYDIEALIAHELAHIRRHDFIVNIVQSVIETLLFYHPGVRWISERVREERENCCDDIAAQLDSSQRYARALSNLEALRREHFHFAMGAGGRSLQARIARLTSAYIPTDSARTDSHTTLYVIALVSTLVVLVAAWQATNYFYRGDNAVLPKYIRTDDDLPKVVISPPPVPFLQLPRSDSNPQEILWDGTQLLKFSDSVPPGERSKSVWIRTPQTQPLHITVIPVSVLPHPVIVVEWKRPGGDWTSDKDFGSGRGGRPNMLISNRRTDEPIRINIYPNGDHHSDKPIGGEYVVCVRPLHDARDIDPETIGIEASPIVLDDSGRAEIPWHSRDDLGRPITGPVAGIDYPGDADAFSLPATSTAPLHITLTVISSGRTPSLHFYDRFKSPVAVHSHIDVDTSMRIYTTGATVRYAVIFGPSTTRYSLLIRDK